MPQTAQYCVKNQLKSLMYLFVHVTHSLILALSCRRLRHFHLAASHISPKLMVRALTVTLLAACGAETPVADERADDNFKQWKLPGRLREISGLALTPDERLLAVTDEKAIVYELDYNEGRIIKSFALGNPVVRADFEGIAVLGDRIWLMTSDGVLFAAEEGPDERSVRYQKFDTGHGDYCELEGLAQDPAAGTLILVCKETNKKKNDLMMFEWTATADGIEHVRSTVIPESSIEDGIDEKKFSPSGITIDPQTGERVIIAARQDALVRLEADGSLSDAIILKKKGRHKQSEGIELTRDGRMLIADEGGDGRARLAVYAATSTGNNKNE